MKGAILVGLMLGGFYMAALHLVMSQVNDMENFYSHMDTYVNQAVINQTGQPSQPQPLRNMMQPASNIQTH